MAIVNTLTINMVDSGSNDDTVNKLSMPLATDGHEVFTSCSMAGSISKLDLIKAPCEQSTLRAKHHASKASCEPQGWV